MSPTIMPRHYSAGRGKIFVEYVVKQTVVRRSNNHNRKPVAHADRSKNNGIRPRASQNITKPIQKKPKENHRPNKRLHKNRKSKVKPTVEDLDRDLECYMKKEVTSIEKPTPKMQPSTKISLKSRRQKNQKPAVTPTVEDLDRELEAYMKKPVV